MKHLLSFLKENDDRGVGLEPLLHEFVYDVVFAATGLSPENKENRIASITGYYKEILSKTKSIYAAYGKTREWAKKTFVAPYAKRVLNKEEE